MEKKINMLRCSYIAFFTILFLLSSCNSRGHSELTGTKSPVASTMTPSLTIIPFSSSTSFPTASPVITSTSELTHTSPLLNTRPFYTINTTLDYFSHSLSVEETIFYQNVTGVSLSELVLAVEPNLWAGCFVLGGVLINGQDAGKITLIADRLVIPLVTPLVSGSSSTVSLQYDLHLPPANTHHVFGFDSRQVNLVDWYPFIVPYSHGWILHSPGDVGEHLAYDVADFDVTITQSDPSQPVILAASASAEMNAGSWQYHLQNVRNFVFSASTAYHSVSTTTDGVTITSYYFPQDETSAGAALDATAKALQTYNGLFSPYPHTSLSIVESPFFDGMEYAGLFFLSQDYYASYDGKLLNNLIDLAVHETAHQWWFGMVGNDQAMEPWLDEALATYSEELFYENKIPQISAWWFFRVESFSPAGWVDSNIYDGLNFRTYANAVYLRGALFLDALRKLIGDPAFFAFLKDYASQMSGKLSTSKDFFRILRTHTSANISDLIASYFQHPY